MLLSIRGNPPYVIHKWIGYGTILNLVRTPDGEVLKENDPTEKTVYKWSKKSKVDGGEILTHIRWIGEGDT